MGDAKEGKKRKNSTADKQQNLKNVRKATASAREDQRITVELQDSDDEVGPNANANDPVKNERGRQPNQRLNKNSTVLNDGMGAVKDLSKVMERQYQIESKQADAKNELVNVQTKQVVDKAKDELLEKALKSAYDGLILPENHKDDKKTEMANLLNDTGVTSPGIILEFDKAFVDTLTGNLKLFPAKAFTFASSACCRVKFKHLSLY
jgi:hypothetical protein